MPEPYYQDKLAPMTIVLDPASGSRMFYFDREDERVTFGDIRDESHTLVDGRALEIHPDVLMDFRDLPYPDESFRVVVFDPPHLNNVGPRGWMGLKYGVLDKETWRDDLRAGFAECFRVLHEYGVLIFKWNETQIPLREILALTPEKPLIGHRSGKTARTHWVTFVKQTPGRARDCQDCDMIASRLSQQAFDFGSLA